MFDGRFREDVERRIRPVGDGLRRSGLTADQLTALGLTLALATAVATGAGQLRWAAVLLIAAAVPDMLDGAVAKASGTASARGAFFDSVADRVADSLILGGIAWHLAVTKGGLAPMLPFAVVATSMLISYERARAESLGYSAKGGLMERAERLILMWIGLAVSFVLIPVLWTMLVLTAITAGQRFVKVWRAATADLNRPARPERRWRTWRTNAAPGSSTRARERARGPRPRRAHRVRSARP